MNALLGYRKLIGAIWLSTAYLYACAWTVARIVEANPQADITALSLVVGAFGTGVAGVAIPMVWGNIREHEAKAK